MLGWWVGGWGGGGVRRPEPGGFALREARGVQRARCPRPAALPSRREAAEPSSFPPPTWARDAPPVPDTDSALLVVGEQAARGPVYRAGQDGRSSLMWASSFGHSKVVELLLDRRADVNAADRVRTCAHRSDTHVRRSCRDDQRAPRLRRRAPACRGPFAAKGGRVESQPSEPAREHVCTRCW